MADLFILHPLHNVLQPIWLLNYRQISEKGCSGEKSFILVLTITKRIDPSEKIFYFSAENNKIFGSGKQILCLSAEKITRNFFKYLLCPV